MKNLTINKLESAIESFYLSKHLKKGKDVQYLKGYCEGMMRVLLDLDIVSREDINQLIKKYSNNSTFLTKSQEEKKATKIPNKLDTSLTTDNVAPNKTTLLELKANEILNDLETPSIFRKNFKEFKSLQENNS
jgi:hypothetical protein